MSSSLNMVKTGMFKGTGAVKKIVLGFKPRSVRLFNADGLVSAWKTDTMDTDKALKAVTAGDQTYAADMVTLNSDGFSVGVDADLNVAGEVVHFEAHEGKNE